MSSFTSPLIVSPMPSGSDWELKRSFAYHVRSEYSNVYILVPDGFVTDFASVPRGFIALSGLAMVLLGRFLNLFWLLLLGVVVAIAIALLPSWAKYNKPSPLHDWLYYHHSIMGKPITRKQADGIFYDSMLIDFRNHASGPFIARVEYIAVRAFGWLAWKKRR